MNVNSKFHATSKSNQKVSSNSNSKEIDANSIFSQAPKSFQEASLNSRKSFFQNTYDQAIHSKIPAQLISNEDLTILKKEADSGSIKAQFRISLYYCREQFYSSAIYYCQLAANHGDSAM